MFRKTGYIYGKVYITGWHFMDFPMPQVGDYELMVRGRYEGGDGPVRKIRLLGEIEIRKIKSEYFYSIFFFFNFFFFFFQVKPPRSRPRSAWLLCWCWHCALWDWKFKSAVVTCT